MPNSSAAVAYLRQSTRTRHAAQISLAFVPGSPWDGKKTSGSLAYAQATAVPFAKRGGGRAGHRDRKQAEGPVSAGAFGHAGSLRESRDGGAVSLGLPDPLNYGKPEPGISCYISIPFKLV